MKAEIDQLRGLLSDKSHMSAKVNVGIRPEDAQITEGTDFAYEGRVNIREALGEVTLLYFEKDNANADPVIAKLPGIHQDMRGETFKFTADPAKVHVFKDGVSLRYL